MPTLTERGVFLWTGLLIAFLALTFSKDLALIYLAIIVLDYILYKEYPSKVILNSVPGNTGRALMIGAIAYVVFMAIAIATMVVLQFGAVEKSPTEAFFRAQWQAGANPLKPIFADNPFFIFLSYGIVIPILETRITGRFLNILTDQFNIRINDFRNWQLWAIYAFISAGAVIFHLQAKGITDNVALTLTFVFWMITCVLISYTKELESAVHVHIINNSVTVAKNVLRWF